MFMFLFLFFSMLLLCSFFRLKELFQVKNSVITSLLFFFFENAKNLGRSDDGKRRKKEDGLSKVVQWNIINNLVRNPSETEVNQFQLVLVSSSTKFSVIFWLNLSVNLEKELNLSHHINETCKKTVLAIRFIGRLRKYLSKDHLKMMVNAFVMSRLDYCNSLYCGLQK